MYLLGHVYFWYNRNDYANFMFLLVFVVLTLNVTSLLLHPCMFKKSVCPESTAPVTIICGLVFLWGRHRYSIYYRIWRRGNWCRILLMIRLADAVDRDCWLYRRDSCGTKTIYPWWHHGMKTPGPRLNIKTVLSRYGDSYVKDETAVRTSYL